MIEIEEASTRNSLSINKTNFWHTNIQLFSSLLRRYYNNLNVLYIKLLISTQIINEFSPQKLFSYLNVRAYFFA